jgi:hypothetical protein
VTINPETIAQALETAPGWAKVALTVPQPQLRSDALLQLGEHIYSTLYHPMDTSRDQLALPL